MLGRLVLITLVFLGGACAAPKPCRLTPFHTGICQLGKDHVLGAGHTARERLPFIIYSFLVESGGRRALVDLGPKTLDYTNEMFRRHGFFRDLGPSLGGRERFPDDLVQPHGNVLAQLASRGVPPEAIDHIVFTHFHADHHGMDDARNGGAAEDFGSAILHASAIGWEDNLSRRREGRWQSYVDYAFSDFLLVREAEGRVRFEDDAEIFPGLRTVYLGGHSVCSQAVVVDTVPGPAIIASDDVYLYELLEGDILPAIRTSPENYRRAIDRLVKLARQTDGLIIPLHDPIVWELYSKHGDESWLGELKKVSDRAIAGYLRRRKG